MKEYHKIETLFKFNQETKRWTNKFCNENVSLLQSNLWLFTEKIDGTNFRIHWNGHKLSYAGRTDNSQFNKQQGERKFVWYIPHHYNHLVIDFINKYLVNEEQEVVFEQRFQENIVTVYGELFGVGIQNGGLYVDSKGLDSKQLDFRVFDIEIGDVFLEYDNAATLAQELGFKFVPIVMIETISQAVEYVLKNDKSTFSNAKLEGLVGKPLGDFRDRLGKRIVVKIKRKDLEKTDGLEEYFNE